jgi:hypothetical protein
MAEMLPFVEDPTMIRFGSTAFAAAFLLLAAQSAKAQDTIRLGGTGDAKVQNLLDDGQSDIEQVYYRGGYRGWGGGYRGWGGNRGWGYGGWGYRGWGYAGWGYRPWLAYRPFYRPYWYASSYYAPSYYPSYYYGQPAYSYYNNPCAGDNAEMPPATVLGSTSSYAQRPVIEKMPYPVTSSRESSDGTFHYDGGPAYQTPLPVQNRPAPAGPQKRPTVPLDGKLVSIPGPTGASFSYPAYGETPSTPAPAATPAIPVRIATTTAPISYPAYGAR